MPTIGGLMKEGLLAGVAYHGARHDGNGALFHPSFFVKSLASGNLKSEGSIATPVCTSRSETVVERPCASTIVHWRSSSSGSAKTSVRLPLTLLEAARALTMSSPGSRVIPAIDGFFFRLRSS